MEDLQLSHHDLGCPRQPGVYPYEEFLVTVDEQHVEAWSASPDLRFDTIICRRAGDDSLRLALGSAARR